MAEETEKKELTPKEIALAHFRGTATPAEKPDDTLTEEEIKAKADQEAAAAKKIEDDAAAAKKKADDEAAAKKLKDEEEAAKNKIEPTDAELLALASKRAGREIKSWDELKPAPTEDDKKKQQDTREAEKLAYGLKKGLFNKTDYDSFVADSKDRLGLVYRAELAEAKKDDPDWDEEKEREFKAEFDERFGIDQDPTSAKHKRGQRQISVMADSLLKGTYGSILQLDHQYDEHERTSTERKQEQQKILSETPAFKENIKAAIQDLSTFKQKFGDEEYEVKVPTEVLNNVEQLLMDEKFVADQILRGKNKKETISQVAQGLMLTQHFTTLSYEVAKQYRERHARGVRGIPQQGRLDTEQIDSPELTERQKQALEHFRSVIPTKAN